MKALTYRHFGAPEVMRVEEVADPVPGDGEVRIRVHAAVVSAADASFRSGKPMSARLYAGMIRPRFPTLGGLVAGEIDAVGREVTRFGVGERVVGFTGPRLGGQAGYVCLPADGALATTPAGLTDAQAVAVCDGALTALPFLRDVADLRPGSSVLVNGASGSVGSAGVQLAKQFGAHVTAVCSTANLDRVRSIGADEVVDYTRDDFTRGTATYDVIFDAVGKSSFARCRRLLRGGGTYLTTVPSLPALWQTVWTRRRAKRAAVAFTGMRPSADVAKDLVLVTGLAAQGRIRPVIDATYPIDRAAEAYRRVDSGHKVGSVVLAIGDAR